MSSTKLATWLSIAAGAIAIYYFLKDRGGCVGCASGSLAATTPYKDWQ